MRADRWPREVFAVDELHCQEVHAVDFADVEHADDIGVDDRSRDSDFAAEAFDHHVVVREALGEDLECHGLAEIDVVSAIHLAHAAHCQQRDDAIARPEQVAR